MPKITISEPGQSPQSHSLKSDQKTISIGRGSDNDITISCDSVSTHHCRIEKTDNGYVLYDDNSTNGIKYDGQKQEQVDLEDGMEVLIGDTPLTFHSEKAAKKSQKKSPKSLPSPTNKTQKKWLRPVIALGLTAMAGVAIMPWLGEVGMASEKATTTIGKWVGFLGEFHPLFLHLPIGALMLVMVMEFFRLVTFGKYQPKTTLALFFAAATGIFAVVFGYCLYLTGEFSGELIEEHKRDGIIFTILLIATFLVKYLSDVYPLTKAFKPTYVMGLLATTATMMSAGHHGGEITHGDPLAKAPWKQDSNDAMSSQDIADPIVYTHIVHPILEQKCISCHGEKKQKSGLRMDTYAYLLEGGDEEECLVPGDTEKSMMIAYLHLPMEDDLHMPPEGKTQLTPEEIQILEWWVKTGAPETARKSEMEVTPAIAKALESLKTPEELAREKAAREKAAQEKAVAIKKQRQLLESSLTKVNNRFPGSLKYISQEDTDLVFSAVSYRKQFQDTDLDILSDSASALTEVNLGASKITDKGVQKLSAYPELEVLKLSETAITDASLPTLAKLKNLRVLNLYGTGITDAGIKALHGHPTLKKVYLWQTKTTSEGAKALEKSLYESQKNKEGKFENGAPKVILGS